MQRNLLLSLLAGVVLFVWGFLSWTVLPWHNQVANQFVDEAVVSQALKDNAPKQGVYYLPFSEKDHGPDQIGAFVNVLPQGTELNMNKQMAIGFLSQVIGAFLVLSLLSLTKNLNYAGNVAFFALTGLIIGFVSHAPYWNWFGFSTPYIVVIILDTLVGWTLAGIAVGKFTK